MKTVTSALQRLRSLFQWLLNLQLRRQNQTLPTPPEPAQWLGAEHTPYRALVGSSMYLAVGYRLYRGTHCCLLELLARTLVSGYSRPVVPQGHTTTRLLWAGETSWPSARMWKRRVCYNSRRKKERIAKPSGLYCMSKQ